MDKKKTGSKIQKEFKSFLATPAVTPPLAIEKRVLTLVANALTPSAFLVFFKILWINAFTGFLSLLLCNQFGVSPFDHPGLSALFMHLGGETICMLCCGAIFLGGGAFIASLVLRPEEVQVLRRHAPLQFAAFGLLSLGTFVFLGADILVSLAVFWFAGAMAGSWLSLELGWRLRKGWA